MAGRRILLFVTLLLLIGVMASAIAPRERQLAPAPPRSEPTPPPTQTARVVDGQMPKEDELRARVGDVVQLSVTHRGRDVAQILALGLNEPVEAGLPARFVFDADHEGRFAVSLRYAGDRLGVVRVLPAR